MVPFPFLYLTLESAIHNCGNIIILTVELKFFPKHQFWQDIYVDVHDFNLIATDNYVLNFCFLFRKLMVELCHHSQRLMKICLPHF